jgi:hypothetical protein
LELSSIQIVDLLYNIGKRGIHVLQPVCDSFNIYFLFFFEFVQVPLAIIALELGAEAPELVL